MSHVSQALILRPCSEGQLELCASQDSLHCDQVPMGKKAVPPASAVYMQAMLTAGAALLSWHLLQLADVQGMTGSYSLQDACVSTLCSSVETQT